MTILGRLAAVFKATGGMTYTRRFQMTGYTNMKNLPKLITAILKTYERPEFQPKIKDGKVVETYCNFAAREIAGIMGYHKFAGKTANQLHDFLRSSSDWKEIDMEDAQFLANQGTLVFASLPASQMSGTHGHICVVRPGEEIYSARFRRKVPAVMNIGGQNFILRFKMKTGQVIDAGVNGAFTMIPKFFAWKDSL